MTERTVTAERPKVGVSLLVVREFDGEPYILLGLRKGSHGDGEWGTPGGHLENGESFEEGALSELEEECGEEIEVSFPKPLCVANLRDYLPKHYIDIGMVSHWVSGDPKLMEPGKCAGWTWHPMDRLPSPLFSAVDGIVAAYRSGETCFV